MRVTVGETLAARRLPVAVETAVYFSCLEALQNTAKHAPAARVSVHLALDDGHLGFVVADDGPGFDAATADGAGTGLLGIGDRVGAVGGTVVVDSRPGSGTTVTGRVPVPTQRGVLAYPD